MSMSLVDKGGGNSRLERENRNSSHMKKIVILEDDHLLLDALCDAFPILVSPELSVTPFLSESAIVQALPRIAVKPPGLFIFDVMVRFDDFGRTQHPDGRFHAGLRVMRHVRAKQRLASVPIIFHSCLELADLQRAGLERDEATGDILYIAKQTGSKVLFDEVRRLLCEHIAA